MEWLERSTYILTILYIFYLFLFNKSGLGLMEKAGYYWTKGSLKAIDECSKIQIKRFKATIVKTSKQTKTKEQTKEA